MTHGRKPPYLTAGLCNTLRNEAHHFERMTIRRPPLSGSQPLPTYGGGDGYCNKAVIGGLRGRM